MFLSKKLAAEIALMREGGRRLSGILKILLEEAKPGVKTKDLDRLAEDLIKRIQGEPSFKTVKGYKWTTCMCVNDEVVHGIPDDILKYGDILCIDVGLLYKGFHTDCAWTIPIKSQKSIHSTSSGQEVKSQKEEKIEKFLAAGKTALENAIKQAKVGNRVGHISKAIQETIEKEGYSVVKALVGHGVGRKLHEQPQIPGFITTDIKTTPSLAEGMVLAIEVIYNEGSDKIKLKNDGWTLVTADGSISAVFEHTIAVTDKGPIILTED